MSENDCLTISQLIKQLNLYSDNSLVYMVTEKSPVRSIHFKGSDPEKIFLSSCKSIKTDPIADKSEEEEGG